jgi:hypothetical protein
LLALADKVKMPTAKTLQSKPKLPNSDYAEEFGDKDEEEPDDAISDDDAEEVEGEEEEEPVEEPVLPECRIISLDGSNIRSGPGMDYEIVASYPYDMVLSLTGEYEIGWYSILAEDGTEGYIFETQIELPEGYVAEEAAY